MKNINFNYYIENYNINFLSNIIKNYYVFKQQNLILIK